MNLMLGSYTVQVIRWSRASWVEHVGERLRSTAWGAFRWPKPFSGFLAFSVILGGLELRFWRKGRFPRTPVRDWTGAALRGKPRRMRKTGKADSSAGNLR